MGDFGVEWLFSLWTEPQCWKMEAMAGLSSRNRVWYEHSQDVPGSSPRFTPVEQILRAVQHRFTGTPLSATAVTGVQSLTGAAPKEYKIAAKATAEFVNASYDLVKGVAGDPLHQFLGANGVEAAKKIETLFASRINKLSADDLRLLALHI